MTAAPTDHATSAAAPPSPLATALVLDAVQRIEAAGPLDDASALQQAFHTQPTRAAQVRQRAWLLGQRLGLQAELARWRPVGWGVLLALAALVALASLGTARAVLGEGRSINAVAAFVSLLGLHLLTLLIWLVGAVASGGGAGSWLGRLALWLTARLPPDRGPHSLTLLQSATALLSRQRLLAWLTGAISHGIWTIAFALMLAVLAFGFAFHAYQLTWETTILSPAFFERFVQITGALPGLLGFPVPDAAAVQRMGTVGGQAAAGGAAQSDWAWWLMGCVLVYGLLPRALLAAFSIARWRAGARRMAEVDMADPYVRRIVQRLDALEPPPQVIDPEHRPTAAATPAPALGPPGAPGSLAVIGFELPPEQAWPAPGLPPTPAGSAAPLRVSGSAAERQQALAQLAATRPESLLLVVHAPSSPDRGTARFVREAARQAGRVALWPVAAAAPSAAGEGASAGGETPADTPAIARWQRWLQSEGFSALAMVPSAPAATNWIAQATPQHQPEPHAASPAPTP
ncbi:DUF2868 domain-containing protein [Ottowia oryzae]|uniref:DUF2868 domain-containing protein n=1 Tax=Ottowia oryzae TaxID=2109914 RepID=A0A2S0MHB2_9BURK|nr:DUF2868 domain-containing protein [Ottowia oryzae]AVO35284.1 DUF2868 domain-containing protein [Ottowia oryzae]